MPQTAEVTQQGTVRVLAGEGNPTFILLAFEGPDRYSLAGGLGVRVTELAQALAEEGFETHLLFVGDPHRPPREVSLGGRLTLHRWCQWISKYYPGGVYHGEEAKVYDFADSVPAFVVEELARPALAAGRLPVIMAEEWQTADAICGISDLLHERGVRSRALLLWNANNLMGFERLNWGRLGYVATITTVSRYMKHLMWRHGVNPLVIPNGISRRRLAPIDADAVSMLRRTLAGRIVLTKVGRWHPDKRWRMAVETVARLKASGRETTLLAFGGVEPHEGEVLDHARGLGLTVKTMPLEGAPADAWLAALHHPGPADVVSLKGFAPPQIMPVVFRASDAVLANSGHEPFGLVGLEAMASGAVTFTGATGEEYAVHLENAIVLETSDAEEAAWWVRYLMKRPRTAASLGRAGRRAARRFLWERVVENLLGKIALLAATQGLAPPATAPVEVVIDAPYAAAGAWAGATR